MNTKTVMRRSPIRWSVLAFTLIAVSCYIITLSQRRKSVVISRESRTESAVTFFISNRTRFQVTYWLLVDTNNGSSWSHCQGSLDFLSRKQLPARTMVSVSVRPPSSCQHWRISLCCITQKPAFFDWLRDRLRDYGVYWVADRIPIGNRDYTIAGPEEMQQDNTNTAVP